MNLTTISFVDIARFVMVVFVCLYKVYTSDLTGVGFQPVAMQKPPVVTNTTGYVVRQLNMII